jgi:hypothetical protein
VIDSLDEYKALDAKDRTELENFVLLEPLFLRAQSYMKEKGLIEYDKLKDIPDFANLK